MKRVLITGAAGFLGSHLCDRFIKDGYHVLAMDNLITGRLKNIEHLFHLEQFEFHNNDVSKFINVSGELDYILHFASPASPIDYLKIPIQTLKVGSLGVHNCLGLAKAKGARILIASTSEVYGDPTVHPQSEEYWGNVNPVGPRGVYDEAKRFQEAITMAYHNFHGLETRIIRIFNTYGPRMRLNDGRVLPAFIGQALRGEDLTIFGDGSQTRSFCYVDDLVEGIVRLLLSDYVYPINVGNPSEITISQFAEEIIQLTGTKQSIIYKDLPVDDPKQRQPDIDDACQIGDGTKIWHFSHLMSNCILGLNCNLGQNVVVSPNVILGNNVKVQNNVSIYTGVICEDDVFLGPSMVFTNVMNPRSAVNRREQYTKTTVKKGASIGANATIVCGNDIGEFAFIGAGSVVTKEVPAYALVVGNPARQIGWMSENGQRLIFDENGFAICSESNEKYELKNKKVSKLEDDK